MNPSVFMITNSNLIDGVPDVFTFVNSQADSIRNVGWKVFLGVIDDRTSARGIMRNVRKLREEITRVRPGIVHAQYGSVTAAVSRYVKGKIPLVVSFCGDDLLGTPSPSLARRGRARTGRLIGLWAARLADAIIVKSDNLFQTLPCSLREKATILPNGVDTDFFWPIDRGEARAKLGWPQGGKVVLFNPSWGENQKRKNPFLARKAIDNLAQVIPDVSLQMLSKANPEEVRLMLNAADCLLVTSLHEGSPNIVKEAMACNLPVISVPCGDVAERLKMTWPGGICFYDSVALSEALEEVLQAGCRSNGREQLIAQGLTGTKIAESLVQIYRHVQEENSLWGQMR